MAGLAFSGAQMRVTQNIMIFHIVYGLRLSPRRTINTLLPHGSPVPSVWSNPVKRSVWSHASNARISCAVVTSRRELGTLCGLLCHPMRCYARKTGKGAGVRMRMR